MNSIWVYGCSWSEPYGLYEEGVMNPDGLRYYDGEIYWGDHLANKLNMNLKSCSMPGKGRNYHTNKIDEDILKWDMDDIIIISPSHWGRITINEFEESLDSTQPYIVRQLKNLDVLCRETEKKWSNKIKTLQFFGYNVFTWIIDKQITNEVVHNLIPVSTEYIDLDTFMKHNKEYWIGTTHSRLPHIEETDWHLNPQGHEYISEQMYNFINKKYS